MQSNKQQFNHHINTNDIMDFGKISVAHSFESGKLVVQMELIDGAVWVTKHQIANLLDVHIQPVTANLKAIFKNKELFEHQVVKYHDYKDKDGLTNTTELYNLDVIIALSFRMQGGYCRLFREWICQRAKQPQRVVNNPAIVLQFSSSNTCRNNTILN